MPFDGSTLDETTKLLITARERIERGWCQGEFESAGGVCAVGALTRTANPLADPAVLNGAMSRLQGVVFPVPISFWNDRPERTKEHVLAAYDRAIAG